MDVTTAVNGVPPGEPLVCRLPADTAAPGLPGPLALLQHEATLDLWLLTRREDSRLTVGAPPTPTLVPPVGTPPCADRPGAWPGTSASVSARRTLLLALHRAGDLSGRQLVDLQLSDVVEHPAGLLVSHPGPAPIAGRPHRFGVGRQPGDGCPVEAFAAWRDLLEQAFLAAHDRPLQPADRSIQPLFCAVVSGGRPTRTRLSAHAAARVLCAGAGDALGHLVDLPGRVAIPEVQPDHDLSGGPGLLSSGPVRR